MFDNLDLLQLLDLVGKEQKLYNDGEMHAKRKNAKRKPSTELDDSEEEEIVLAPSSDDSESLSEVVDEPCIDVERTESDVDVVSEFSSDDDATLDSDDDDNNSVCWSGEPAVKHLPVQRRNVTRAFGVGRLLSCPAQPFHMRLSLMGELFNSEL